MLRRNAVAAGLAAAVPGLHMRAQARSFPSQPIKLLAPFPPGGSVDINSRMIAEPLGRKLGAQVVQSPELRERFSREGFEPFATKPEAAGQFVAAQIKRWGSLIKAKNIKID